MPDPISRRQVNQENDPLSIRDLIAPLFRRKTQFLIVLATVFVLASVAGLAFFHKFKSQMAVLVNRERIESLVSTGVQTQTVTEPVAVAEEEINSEAELILSQDVLEKVVIANHLEDKKNWLDLILPRPNQQYRIAKAVKTLARKIKVKPSIKANLIDVSYTSDDPRLSFAVLNSLSSYYLEKHAMVHQPQGSYSFFAAETDRYKRALDDSEAKLRSFAQTPGGAAPDTQRADLDQQLTNSIGQLHTTEQAIAADQMRISNDQAQIGSTPQRSTTQLSSAPPDMLLQQLGSVVLAAQTKRTQLALKYDPNYPLVKEADDELAEAKAAYQKAEDQKLVTENTNVDPTYELLREDLAKTQADLAAQRASLAANRTSIESMQGQMSRLAQKNIDLRDLLREQKANEDNYLLYLAKREQARTSDALDKTKIENVAIANPPAIPVLPLMSIPMVLMLAFVVALFLSVMTAYGLDYFDSSFHTPTEVAEALGIPVVFTMPKREVA